MHSKDKYKYMRKFPHSKQLECHFCKMRKSDFLTVMGSLICHQCWDTIAAIAIKAINNNLPEQQEPYKGPRKRPTPIVSIAVCRKGGNDPPKTP